MSDLKSRTVVSRPLLIGGLLIGVVMLIGAAAAAVFLLRGKGDPAAAAATTDPATATVDPFANAGHNTIETELTAYSLPIYDIALKWQPIDGASEYNVYRRRVDILEPAKQIGSALPDQPAFVDVNAHCGATYQYAVSWVVNHEEQMPAFTDRLQLTIAPCPAASVAQLTADAPALNVWTGETDTTGSIALTTAPFAAVSPTLREQSFAIAKPASNGQSFVLTHADGSAIGYDGLWANGSITSEAIWGNGGTMLPAGSFGEGIWGNGGTFAEGIWGNGGTFMEVYIVPAGALPETETAPDPDEWIPTPDQWVPIPADSWVVNHEEQMPVPHQWFSDPDNWIPEPTSWMPDPTQWIPHQGTVEITPDGLVVHPTNADNTILTDGGGFYLIPKPLITNMPTQQLPAVDMYGSDGVKLLGQNTGGYLHGVTGDFGAFDDPLVGFDDPLVGFDDPLVGFDDPLVGMPYALAVPDMTYAAPAGDGMSLVVFTMHPHGSEAIVEYIVYTPLDGALIFTPYAPLADLMVGGVCSSGDGVCDPSCSGGGDADCGLQTCISGDGVCSSQCASSADYMMSGAMAPTTASASAARTDLDCLVEGANAVSSNASLPMCNATDGVCSAACVPTALAGADWECIAPCAADGFCSPLCRVDAEHSFDGSLTAIARVIGAGAYQGVPSLNVIGQSPEKPILVSYSESPISQEEELPEQCFDVPAIYDAPDQSPESMLGASLTNPDSLCMSGGASNTYIPGLPGVASEGCAVPETNPVTVRVCMPVDTTNPSVCKKLFGSIMICAAGTIGDLPEGDGDNSFDLFGDEESDSEEGEADCGTQFQCMQEAALKAAQNARDEEGCGNEWECLAEDLAAINDAIEDATDQTITIEVGDDECSQIADPGLRAVCRYVGFYSDHTVGAETSQLYCNLPQVNGGMYETLCVEQDKAISPSSQYAYRTLAAELTEHHVDPDCQAICEADGLSCACLSSTASRPDGCFNPNAVMPAPPTPTAAPTASGGSTAGGTSGGSTGGSTGSSDICADLGGVSWQGEICVCPGFVDQVTFCGDGTRFDNITQIACTPTESCNSGGTSGGTTGGTSGGSTGGSTGGPPPPVCGNGILETGEGCENNSHCSAGAVCITTTCTCQIIN